MDWCTLGPVRVALVVPWQLLLWLGNLDKMASLLAGIEQL